MMNFKLEPTSIGLSFMLVLLVFLVLVGPLLTLWALNTLFPNLALAYSFTNWCAVVVLHSFFTTTVTNRR